MIQTTKWTQLRGDGGTQPCDAKTLTLFKDEFKQLAMDAGLGANDRRQLADDIRFCRWPGQSPDGKKHADALNGKAAFPFEGASDRRERTADSITNEQVIIIMAALMRLNIAFTGTPGANATANDLLADQLAAVWEFAKRNMLGTEWFVEWTKFVQWRQGDSPAVGVMQVSWHQVNELKPVTVSAQDVADMATSASQAQQRPLSPQDEQDLVDVLQNPARADELASLLQSLWPEMRDSTANKAATALHVEGEATFPYPAIVENRLKLKARRLFDDAFVPENTTDPRRARMMYFRDWYTEVELRERDAKGEFKPNFLEEVLKHEGETGWTHVYRYDALSGTYADSPLSRGWDKNRQRGMYELITVMYRAVNKDGIPGVYSVEYHHAVDIAGTDQALLDYEFRDARYPVAMSPREILTHKLWDSRGNAELSATEQNALKILHDMFIDNAQLSTVPPIEVPASRPKMALVWGPLKQIKVNRTGEIKTMPPLPYPQAAGEMLKDVRGGLARYFGQFADSNPPDLVRLYNQSLVDFMMLPVMEVMWMGLSLCIQFLPDEQLASIVGEGNVQSLRSLKGDFHVETSFEAGMLSLDFIKTVGDFITKYVVPLDRNQTLPTNEIVKCFLAAVLPTVANKIRPVEEADAAETDDEEKNFTKIAAGVEPPMMEDGQNWQLRRDTLLGIGQKNPQAFQLLAPNSRLILEARLKHFDGMLEQQQNAQIGRTMAAPALQGAPQTGAAPVAAAPAAA